MDKVEMIIHSINVALIDYQRAVVLKEKNGERYLPMWIDAIQADAILTGMSKSTPPEPLTHDFVCLIIYNLGATLEHVVVYKLAGDIHQAKAILKKEDKIIEIDCRPSDAIATALRVKMPIFVTEKLLEEVAISIEEINKIDKSGKES